MSGTMNDADPRMVLRDAIAAKIHAATCNKCPGDGEPRFSDEQIAEKVMELFTQVKEPQISVPSGKDDWAPYRYLVARTSPVRVEVEADGAAA